MGPDEDELLVVQRRPRWLPVLVAAVLVAVVTVLIVVHARSRPSAAPRQSPTTLLSSPADEAPSVIAPTASVPPVIVTTVGHEILGVTAGWELFGRGDGVMVRVQLALGRVTTTAVPALGSTGPVFFVLGADEALIRPLDFVPGYLVPDGRPAHQISAARSLGQGGPVFPGPDPDHVWAESMNSNPPVLGLVALDGNGVGPVLPMPRGESVLGGQPDGAGYVLFTEDDGTYDSRPNGLHRITTGFVWAAGPTRWLAMECHGPITCVPVVIDQSTGARRVLRASLGALPHTLGVIAPDGSAAAFVRSSPTPALEDLDLETGVLHVLPLRIEPPSTDAAQSLAWSPDSRWLFAVDTDGHVQAIDARTRRITDLSARAHLPPLSQLAIR